MTRPTQFDPEKPPLEHFAAYADGELRGDDLIRLEEWLCAHPEDAVLVEAQQQPSSLCRRSAPPEPTEAEWSAAFEKIEIGLASSPAQPAGRSKGWRASTGFKVAMLATAAAAVVAVVLYSAKWGVRAIDSDQPADGALAKDQASPGPENEILEEDLAYLWDPAIPILLLSPEDVDILSLDGADDSAIVVGTPPVGKTFSLVSPGDVVLRSAAADVDGVVPEMRVPPGPAAVPMIVAPMIGSNSDQKKP
jgi:hypothetical protein